MIPISYLSGCGGLVQGPVWALAFKWFHQPLPLDSYWLVLFVPLVVVICVVYKAIKLDDLSQLPRRAGSLAIQIILFMLVADVALWLMLGLV